MTRTKERATLRPPITRRGADLAFLVLVVALAVVVGVLSWLGHEVYEAVTEGDGVATVDHPALDLAVDVRSPGLTSVAQAVTFAAGRVGLPVLAALVIGLVTWRRRDWTAPVLVATSLAGALALTVLGKNLVGRLRPPAAEALPPFETSPAWPSGHSLNATVLAVLAAYLILITAHGRGWRVTAVVGCLLFAMAVGLSRVYLGQHWLTDVMGGWAVGAAWALAVVLSHRLWLRLRPEQSSQDESFAT